MANQLTEDQKRIIRLIEKEAIKAGLNPDFALAVAQAESDYQHIPATDKSSTAFGPFQVNKPTAGTLGVDYEAMKNNPELAVQAGIKNLLSHANNPKLGGDPARIIAAHHYGADSPFALTGDLTKLNKDQANYIASIGELLPTGEFPETVLQTQNKEPEATAKEVTVANEENVYGGTPVSEYDSGKRTSPMETGAMSGLYGAGAGAIYSAHAPALRLAQKVGLLPGGKPITPTDAADLVERTMTANAPEAKPLQGGEKWQKSLTGISTPGAQMGKSSLDLAKDMQSAVGVKGAPGFTGGTITEGGIILNPRDAAAVQAKQAAAAKPFVLPQPTQDAAQRVTKSILGSAPVKGGLAGLGVGYNVQDAYNKFDEGDMLGGTLATTGAGMSALGLVPKLAARANPAAIGFTTASQVAGDLRRGDKQSAVESGLTGAAGLLPRIFGPLGALVYSGGLNKDEDKELQRRRVMSPTLSP
jgi:hypothetical protein